MVDPIAFSIGSLHVRWYGIFYGVGLLFSVFCIHALAKKRKWALSLDAITDLAFWVFLFGVILGGRLGYVLFYNLSYYIQNPLKILAVWEGGMSFHGGLLGAIIVGILYCRHKKWDPWMVGDLVVIPASLSLALGRLGNFINGELVGRVIENQKWNFLGVDFFGDGVLRYPSQLFASFKDIVIFALLLVIFYQKPKKGVIFGSFLILYGLFRFTVEFWRAPDPQIGLIAGMFTLGQIFSVVVFAIGLFLFMKKNNA